MVIITVVTNPKIFHGKASQDDNPNLNGDLYPI
jgi:hypothetical protein